MGIIIALSGLSVPFACEEKILFVDCSQCSQQYPQAVEVSIRFTIDEENPEVSYTVYCGTVENGEVVFEGKSVSTSYKAYLDIDCYYSVKAEYHRNGVRIYAVDGKELRTRKEESACDEPCYVIIGDKFDVRLKY